jgi:NitT/TauT family transport system substrate-binding protein
VFILLLAGCGDASQGNISGRSLRLGLIPGAQSFVDFVMESQSIAEQYDLNITRVKSLRPANLHLMIAEREVDIGYAGFTTMATARTVGKDVIIIGGVFAPVNMVFARHDSPIRTLNDLRGKKLGIFGGPGSTTVTILAVIASKWHDLDLFQEVKLVSAPSPALIELLGRGEVDAAILGTTESIQMEAQERYRVLVNLSEEYRRNSGGRAPAHVTIATNEQFAGAHPDIVRDYLKAYRQTVVYIKEHPEVWDEYAASINIESDKERRLLREKMSPNIIDQWDAEQIAVQQEYLELVHQIIGGDVLSEVPGDLIREHYHP